MPVSHMRIADAADAALRRPVPRGAPTRDAALDVLRGLVTLLVVLHHTAITYGAEGGWFYIERTPDGSPTSLGLSFFCGVNQAWFMGLFFLLAGHFTPGALQRKGPVRFMADRLLRLGLPWLVFVLALGPLTVALAGLAKGQAFTDTLMAVWQQGRVIVGPLWFAQALLGLSLLAVLWQGLTGTLNLAVRRPLPSHAALVVAAVGIGLVAFAVRLWWPTGRQWFGLQWGYFPSYVLLFAVGCWGASSDWLGQLPAQRRQVWRRVMGFALPVLPAVVLLAGSVPALRGVPAGGWSVPALVYALWEPLVAWGLILWALWASQRRFAQPGPLWQALGRRAYAVYVIHPPVLVVVALALRDLALPAGLKFALTGSLAIALCLGLAGALLRVPAVARVL